MQRCLAVSIHFVLDDAWMVFSLVPAIFKLLCHWKSYDVHQLQMPNIKAPMCVLDRTVIDKVKGLALSDHPKLL